jgi:hypothetical protein
MTTQKLTIPATIKCPSCGIESDTIKLKQQGRLHYFNGKWLWDDPADERIAYICDECGEELPDSDELELIVESAI